MNLKVCIYFIKGFCKTGKNWDKVIRIEETIKIIKCYTEESMKY